MIFMGVPKSEVIKKNDIQKLFKEGFIKITIFNKKKSNLLLYWVSQKTG